ncbi:Beta-1,3-N-Acetylglucosaminyltransferase family protein [Parasponia andersonii]|uniref:Beta-1,3-N-Acetylglucosaminyltransferase family protein n=1 Tax=Parasponia andersonii TaxID=3476 RepID=A0A2P5DDG0_PARAD|nr:Beta-1,3-N-Acetylglucosaminyltransferase family protein [Parasponia andersonii]
MMKKSLCLVLVFIILVVRGSSQAPYCSEKNLTIYQYESGALVENKPEWTVIITNGCVCGQMDVELDCFGYQTVKPVDPLLLTSNGQTCLVNNGQFIYGSQSFNFTYAWDSSFPFRPISSQIACS